MPPEDGIGPDDTRYLFECSLANLFSDLGQCSPLTIAQAQTALQLIAENTILGNEVLVAQEQFVIDRSCDVRQRCLPVHCVSPRGTGQYGRPIPVLVGDHTYPYGLASRGDRVPGGADRT